MAFNWNFNRQPDLSNYIGAQIDPYNASRIASENMQGYTPNAAFTPGTPSEQAAAAMQGYTQNPQGGQFSVPNDMHGGMGQPDLEGYGESLQAASDAAGQAQALEQQKTELQSQIKALEKRIAENTAKLQNWTGNANEIAAIEARKINSQDPTMVWRWKQGQDAAKQQRAEDMKRIEAEKQNNKEEQKKAFMNKLNSTLPTMAINLNTSPEQAQMYKNTLADLEAQAANYNISDPRIAEMKSALYGDLPYNAMMSAIDELEDINANYGKGSDYDKMNDAQKFDVFRNKLETSRQKLINDNPALWEMMQRDSRYRNKFNTLLSERKPKSKGKDPVRATK